MKTSKNTKSIKATAIEKRKFKKMIFDLFEVCDMWVDVESFVRFENDFSKVAKKYGFDLHQIYYGRSFAVMKKTFSRYDELTKKIEFPFSDEAKPKRAKGGTKYVVFASLPLDQQKAWTESDSAFTCPIIKEEPEDTFCIHYHDYQKFYDAWVKGFMAAHID